MASRWPAARAFVSRRRRWLVLLGVLVVLRAALPEVVRRVLVSQLSQRLRTRVDVGDVDLALHRGGVALEDVALYAPDAPGAPPVIAWKRLAVELRYLPLLWKTVQLRDIELEGPHVALDRLASGDLNLRRLLPPSEPSPAAPPAPQPSGRAWKTGIDRFVLRGGGVRFRDLTLGEGAPLDVALPDVTVRDVALQPGLYGDPGVARVYVKSEGGVLRIECRLWVLDQGFAVATRLKAFRIPLHRARLYIPGIGWSELAGELDASIDHAIAPATRNELGGMVRLRNVAVRVPDVPQAALAVERLAVRVEPIDLAAHRARVAAVDVAGASVVVDLQGGADVLPLLRRRSTEAPPAEAAPETPPSEAAPWRWTVDALDLADSKVSLLQEGSPLDVGITASVRRLASHGDPGRVDLKLSVPPGSVAVVGAARAIPPAFGGTVRIEQLPVQDLVRAAHAAVGVSPGLLQAAALGADLAVEAGLSPDGGDSARTGAVAVKGNVTLDGVQLQGPDPGVFAVAWRHLGVPIDALELPGVLPAAAPAAPAAIHVALGDVRLEEPSVQATRAADGLVIPPIGRAADERAAPPTAPPPAATPAPDVSVASFVLARGRIGLVDQTVKPFFTGEIKPLDIEAHGIRSEGPVLDRFTLSATTPQKGKIDVTGSLRPEGGKVQVNGKDVALTPYNPYVSTFSPYSLGRGSSLSVRTGVAFGKGKYDTKTALTLQRLSVKGAAGDTVFKEHFGIPLSLALALLRDPGGNIKLDIPVAVDQSGTTIALGTVIAGALRSAIVGAVTSPLKAVGIVVGSGDKEVALEPPPIGMELGRAAVTPDGQKQVAQLAALLGGRPGLGVELVGVVVAADACWLQEQDLRAELEARTGVVNALRGLPERNARRRITQALADRAAGKPGDLDRDDRARLDEWLAARPPIAKDRLGALARARAEAVVTLLRERHGIPATRVTVGEAAGEPREGTPSVLIAFGGAGE